MKPAHTLARQDGEEVHARHFQIVLDVGELAFAIVTLKSRQTGSNLPCPGLTPSFIGARFSGYMQLLKKMDRERLAEAIGTRLDRTAINLQSLETPVANTSKRTPEDGPKKVENKEVDCEWG